MTKTSYYTGYEDLDEALSALYERQVLQERDQVDTSNTIKMQDHLLLMGRKRDEKKNSEL